MSYCRYGDDSDFYIIEESETEVRFYDGSNTIMDKKDALICLLKARERGEKVTDYCINRLKNETR